MDVGGKLLDETICKDLDSMIFWGNMNGTSKANFCKDKTLRSNTE